MSNFKLYRKKDLQQMRPYVPGEDMEGISVSSGDRLEAGGMIAQAKDDPADQWYVSKEYFQKTYELVE